MLCVPFRHLRVLVLATGVQRAGLCASLTLSILLGCNLAHAADVSWVSGKKLDEQLAAAVTVSWTNLPLGRALASLAETQHVATLLDRRIDPDREISLSLSRRPLADAFQQIASDTHTGYCQFGPLAYFGPEASARRLRTLAAMSLDQARALGASGARKFLVLRSWQWDDLSEPRELVAHLAAETDVKVAGAERVPHDLWRGADLPPLSWLDRMTLVLAEFDLTFRIEHGGTEVEIIKLPGQIAVTRNFAAKGDAAKLARTWSRSLPDARITFEKGRIQVIGRVEDQEWIETQLRGKPLDRPVVTAGPEVYKLSVEKAALDSVLNQLANRLELQLDWDRPAIDRARISTEQLITVQVSDVSLDELLRAVLAGTGLNFRRTGQKIAIFPAAL